MGNTGDSTFSKFSGTAVDCERDGHWWHGGTAVGSLYCCKCGKYLNPIVSNLDTRLIFPENLTVTRDYGVGQHIREAIRIFKYDDNGNFIKEIE